MAAKIGHIVLAFWVFCSSFGVLVNQHYCRNELKDASLYTPAKACHTASMGSCPMHAKKEKTPKGCCDDQSQYLKHKQEQAQSTISLPEAPSGFGMPSPLLPLSFQHPFEGLITPYLNYKPPLLACDLPVSLQVFRL